MTVFLATLYDNLPLLRGIRFHYFLILSSHSARTVSPIYVCVAAWANREANVGYQVFAARWHALGFSRNEFERVIGCASQCGAAESIRSGVLHRKYWERVAMYVDVVAGCAES